MVDPEERQQCVIGFHVIGPTHCKRVLSDTNTCHGTTVNG